MIQRHELYVGKVVLFRGKLAKVKKVNPKTIHIVLEDGQGWRVTNYALSEAPAGAVFDAASATAGERLVLGTLVKPLSGFKCPYPLLVVVGERAGTYRLAPLGGDKGRYFTGISAAQVEIVTFKTEGV